MHSTRFDASSATASSSWFLEGFDRVRSTDKVSSTSTGFRAFSFSQATANDSSHVFRDVYLYYVFNRSARYFSIVRRYVSASSFGFIFLRRMLSAKDRYFSSFIIFPFLHFQRIRFRVFDYSTRGEEVRDFLVVVSDEGRYF